MSTHTEKVEDQFGRAAGAYLESNVHRQGPDLLALKEILKEILNASPNANLLDLGCGAGHLSYTAAELVKQVTAYDLSSEMLHVVQTQSQLRNIQNLSIAQGRVETLPFEDNSFDFVCTRYSAHHWSDVPAALRESQRVLKPNGTVVIMDIYAPALPLLDTHLQAIELLRDTSHVRDYSLREWSDLLAAAGFSTQEPSTWKVNIDFTNWVQRMSTRPLFVDAMRSLLSTSPQEVRDHFRVLEDGSFTMDTMLMTAIASTPCISS